MVTKVVAKITSFKRQIRSFGGLNMIKAILIDLSGTLHIENEAIPGAVDALKRLRNTNLTIKFVTNTTKESRRTLHNRLTQLGFDVSIDDIHSSLAAARNLIISRNLKPLLLLSSDALEDFEGLSCKEGEKPDAVVIGLAPSEFHYERLNQAFRCLIDGAALIAIHAGKRYARKDGISLGPGCFVKGLEYSADCKAELVGKPNAAFFRSALGDIPPEQAIMIGDDVTDDVLGALNAGMKGILVQTGKYKPGEEDTIDKKPTAVVPTFVEAVEYIIKEKEN